MSIYDQYQATAQDLLDKADGEQPRKYGKPKRERQEDRPTRFSTGTMVSALEAWERRN